MFSCTHAEPMQADPALLEKFTPEELEDYRDAFEYFDRKFRGRISGEDVFALMRGLGETAVLQEFVEQLQTVSADGLIDFNGFLLIMARNKTHIDTEEELLECFRILDENNSGKITEKDLRFALTRTGETLTDEQFEVLLPKWDITNDCYVYYEEIVDRLVGKTSCTQELMTEWMSEKPKSISSDTITLEMIKKPKKLKSSSISLDLSTQWQEKRSFELEYVSLLLNERKYDDICIPEGVLLPEIDSKAFELAEQKRARMLAKEASIARSSLKGSAVFMQSPMTREMEMRTNAALELKAYKKARRYLPPPKKVRRKQVTVKKESVKVEKKIEPKQKNADIGRAFCPCPKPKRF